MPSPSKDKESYNKNNNAFKQTAKIYMNLAKKKTNLSSAIDPPA